MPASHDAGPVWAHVPRRQDRYASRLNGAAEDGAQDTDAAKNAARRPGPRTAPGRESVLTCGNSGALGARSEGLEPPAF
jgi:hypothetical protein